MPARSMVSPATKPEIVLVGIAVPSIFSVVPPPVNRMVPLPAAPALLSSSVPANIRAVPEKALALPRSTSVPVPASVTVPPPERSPSKVTVPVLVKRTPPASRIVAPLFATRLLITAPEKTTSRPPLLAAAVADHGAAGHAAGRDELEPAAPHQGGARSAPAFDLLQSTAAHHGPAGEAAGRQDLLAATHGRGIRHASGEHDLLAAAAD